MKLAKKLFLTFFKLSVALSLFGLVYIVYALSDKLDTYLVKNDKYDGHIQVQYNDIVNSLEVDSEYSSVKKFVSCYKEPIIADDFPEELKSKMNELYELFSGSDNTLSFSYEDLYTGLHVSYNENQVQFAASSIKAPVITYLYEKADKGEIDLNSEITYTSNYFVEGSGSLQYSEFGKSYSFRDLAKKSIVESDNIAYQMISYNLNKKEITSYWNDLGTSNFWGSTIWSDANSNDGVIYMKELYKYYLTGTENSKELMNNFYNSVLPLIKSSKEIPIAHKSGWRASIVHDFALVLDEHPYAVAIMSDLGYDDYKSFFEKASLLIEEFHNIYWNNKANYCYKQSF